MFSQDHNPPIPVASSTPKRESRPSSSIDENEFRENIPAFPVIPVEADHDPPTKDDPKTDSGSDSSKEEERGQEHKNAEIGDRYEDQAASSMSMIKLPAPLTQTSIQRRHSSSESDGDGVGSGAGDVNGGPPIHYESFYEPKRFQRCWTVRDFPQVSKMPKLLKPYKLVFEDAVPPVTFTLGISKNKSTLVLQPHLEKSDLKQFGKQYVKYGFSLGPHLKLGEDFSLETPLLQIKKLAKNHHLNILEMERISKSYLVDGDLNMIIRLTHYDPKTQPVLDPVVKSSDELIQNCSQFSFRKSLEKIIETPAGPSSTSPLFPDLSEDLATFYKNNVNGNEGEDEDSDSEDSEEDVPPSEFYRNIRSKPLRHSGKSLLSQRRREPFSFRPQRHSLN